MNLNYLAFFLISFVPLLIAFVWYRPNSFMMKWSREGGVPTSIELSPMKILVAFILSVSLVYGYMNLTIHQLGFYELFFTDIMKGSQEAKQITSEFLAKYGQKHRHFGHGVLHGALNAFMFSLPMVGFFAIVENRNKKFLMVHFSYWLVTGMVIGGLISEFV